MNRFFKIGLLTCGLFCNTFNAGAEGFAFHEASARANAMGGAMYAIADDPSAIFYNPAGITQIKKAKVEGGITLITPVVHVTTNPGQPTERTQRSEDRIWYPPHFYFAGPLTEDLFFGFGIYSRFGLGSVFDENWEGRFNNYRTIVRTISFNPNLAYKVTDSLSVSAGVTAMRLDIEKRQKIRLVPGEERDLAVEGESWGYGSFFGIHYKPIEELAFGFSYQSRVKQAISDGIAKVGPGVVTNVILPPRNDYRANGAVVLPDRYAAGVAIKPAKCLTFELSVVYTDWSTFDQLAIDIPNTVLAGNVVEKDWKGVFRYQLGGEYKLNRRMALRAGFVYDNEPSPNHTVDYMVPGNDRLLSSVGFGYNYCGWTYDVSYTYLYLKSRNVNAAGRPPSSGIFDSRFDDSYAHLVGVTIGRQI